MKGLLGFMRSVLTMAHMSYKHGRAIYESFFCKRFDEGYLCLLGGLI